LFLRLHPCLPSIVHTGWAEPSPRSWARFGPAHAFGSGSARFQKLKNIYIV
jgi:hypothetical protein